MNLSDHNQNQEILKRVQDDAAGKASHPRNDAPLHHCEGAGSRIESGTTRSTPEAIHSSKKIFLSAGEPSGDLLGAELVNALKKQNPHLIFRGMGSDNMQAAGVDLVVNCRDLAIVGFFEVLKQLPKIRRVMKKIEADLKQHRPDCLILIDYPGFNLRLAKIAKRLGIKVFYYSCPQIWAWHYSRIKKIKQYVNHMLTLFPFEEKMYQRENMSATFVGHPMVQRIQPTIAKNDAFVKYGLDSNKPVVALLPGSRESEIKRLLPDMLAAATLIKQKIPDVQFVLPLAENLDEKWIASSRVTSVRGPRNDGVVGKTTPPPRNDGASEVRHCEGAGSRIESGTTRSTPEAIHLNDVSIIKTHRYDVLQCADAAIAVSGTVTLELALMQIPMIVIYKVSALNYAVGKHLIRAKHIGLCNIVAEKEIAKEAIQHDVNPNVIADEIIRLLQNKIYRDEISNNMRLLKEAMSLSNPAEKAAHSILTLFPL